MSWATKYRPRTLDQVMGQDWSLRMIRGALSKNERPGAWLLHGPWGAGKTTIARILSKSLICINRTPLGEACNQCEQCLSIDEDSSLNYTEVDSASYGGVDAMRTLIEESRLAPIGGAERRVVVLDEAHMLSVAAQNSLLKTLEEGIFTTCFILVTTDPDRLKSTIQSRCIVTPLTPVGRDLVIKRLHTICQLEKVEYEEDAIKLIVINSHGHVRDAITALEQMSLAGCVTLENVRKHLNLHIDDSACKILCQVDSDWNAVMAEVENIAQECPPEEVWNGLKRSISRAYLNVIATGSVAIGHYTKKLSDIYGSRLMSVSEWCLGYGDKISVKTTYDLMIAIALLKDKLGVVATSESQLTNKKLGTPREKRRSSTITPPKPLEVDKFLEELGLESDDLEDVVKQ